ncbi:uncharacterized protein LOC126792475 [Argentina anserina]|uniref:uncharacterized protein LOC126792475 n=1 Tax=Argentina anserina TaxID=57926 RepID=UPI0021766797|nr:uncharacterized protein LOC126792475 [Potentilla anserina]
MEVSAMVSLQGDTRNGKQKKGTEIVPNCDTNPTDTVSMSFALDNSLLAQHNPSFSIVIKLFCMGTLHFNIACLDRIHVKPIGSVHVPLKDLFDSANDMKLISFPVQLPYFRCFGSHQGELTFSYKFGDKFESSPSL